MVLVHGLALLLAASDEGFGQPMTVGFGLSQTRRIAEVAARGCFDDIQFPGIVFDVGRAQRPESDAWFWTIERDRVSVHFNQADSRASLISSRQTQKTQDWHDLPDGQEITDAQIETSISRLLEVCGYPCGAEIWHKKRSRHGSNAALSVSFRPTLRDVPYDEGSEWNAYLDPETGRVSQMHLGALPRPPESFEFKTTQEDAADAMTAELFRLGVREIAVEQPARLVITHADPSEVPATQREYDALAWEKCPRGALMYEGCFGEADTWIDSPGAGRSRRGYYKKQWTIYVDAQTGKLARVEPEP